MTLRVNLIIEPNGEIAMSRKIGEIEIINVTSSGGRMSSDYAWRLHCRTKNKKTVMACGYIVDSNNGNALQLVGEVLAQWESKRSLPTDNHGRPRLPEGMPTAAEYWEQRDWKQLADSQ